MQDMSAPEPEAESEAEAESEGEAKSERATRTLACAWCLIPSFAQVKHPGGPRWWEDYTLEAFVRYLTHGKTFDIIERKGSPTATFDKFEIEAVGPLVLLENFPDLFRGSLWLHLVNGWSSVTQGDILIGAKWSQVQRLHVSNGLAVWKRNQTL